MNKSILNAIALATGLLLFAGCKKETVAPPTVKVFDGAITLNCTSAGVSAEVTDQGGAEVKSRGFVYGLSGGSLDTVFCGSGVGVYSAELNNLQPNTTYVYEAFAKNAGGTGSSGKVSFTTKPLPTYTISISADPSDGGVVNGGGSFQESQYCTVIATANDGYTFTNWTEDADEVSTDANYTFIVNGNRTLKANFRAQLLNEYTISLSANPNNGGSVSGGGTYQEGESCTVSATSNNGYTFTNWTEDGNEISTDANYSFNVNSNRVLVANFTILPPNSYAINVSANPTEGGTVSGGGAFDAGTSHTVTATANEGYSFTNWTENGNVVSTSANYTFTVTANRTLVANFTANAPNQYTINVSANPAEGGTVSGGGTFNSGTSRTVTATANEGYTFTNWTENGNEVSTNANYTFTVTSNRTLVANFTATAPNQYTINVSANPTEGGTVTGGGTYQEGQSCTLTATFTVSESASYVAHFDQQSYNISLSASPSNGGSVSGGGIYHSGQPCTVHAVANTGYSFTNWTENGNVVSTNANYTFTVTDNHTLIAVFNYNGLPQGIINGEFSVSDTQRVYFSKGNLQYKPSNGTWRFPNNQYDYIGEANSNISPSYDGWIDLFGWGTSGWNSGNTYYHPWDSNTSCDECYGPPGNYNLTGNYANSDWGSYNAISNGGNASHTWRTLTKDEWEYVFFLRSTASGIRYARAIVNGVNGMILLPDNWNSSYYSLNNTNQSGSNFSSNVISSTTWDYSFEAHGAVFLPAAGNRTGTLLYGSVGNSGSYWSSTSGGIYWAMELLFMDGYISTFQSYSRDYGLSVRLVCPAN